MTDKIRAALDAAIAVEDCGINGMSMRGQILFPHLHEIREALNAQAGGGWQDISTAPRDGTRILGFNMGMDFFDRPTEQYEILYFDDNEDEELSEPSWVSGVRDRQYEQLYTYKPTHWKPLLPPADGGAE